MRFYVYRHDAGRRPSRISYAWCASCRRFKGWTGPDLDNLKFKDPLGHLSHDQRRTLETDFESFLNRLDKLWEEGKLPQTFTRRLDTDRKNE